jgi:hypothetical protein
VLTQELAGRIFGSRNGRDTSLDLHGPKESLKLDAIRFADYSINSAYFATSLHPQTHHTNNQHNYTTSQSCQDTATTRAATRHRAAMMPKTMVIVRVSEASELFEPAATGSTLTHGLSQGRDCGDEVDMTSKVINLRWDQRLVGTDTQSMRQ